MFDGLKTMWRAGGVTVETTVTDGGARPGDRLHGEVIVRGGEVERAIEGIGLRLFVTVSEWRGSVSDGSSVSYYSILAERSDLVEGFTLAPADVRRIPFALDVPWETPLTLQGGDDDSRTPFRVPPLEDPAVASEYVQLRTRLAVDGSRDRRHLDPVVIRALPAHSGVFAALERIGFWFNVVHILRSKEVDSGVEQTFRLLDAPDYPFVLAVKFRTDATKVRVLLQGIGPGRYPEERDGELVIEHARVEGFDFERALRGALDTLAGDWRA
jgi:sporulation-control protein spo0M